MLVLALSLAGLGAGGCFRGTSTTPNLVLVTIDSLRADRLGCYGGEPEVGARICSLGEEGIRYAWAFSTASSSAPAVASLLTARYPSEHRVQGDPASFLRSSETTLAEEFRAAGRLTAAVVSSPELNRSRNLQQGFASFDDQMSGSPGTGQRARRAGETTDATLEWVRAADGPWLLWVHYRDLQNAYDATQELPAGIGQSAPGSLDEALDRELPVVDDESGLGGIPRSRAVPGVSRRSHYEALYDAALQRIDGEIGRLIDELAAAGTPFGMLLTSDHGMAFGEDDRYLVHGHSLGLEQIRVPLFWQPPRGPGKNAEADPSARRSPPAARRVLEPVSTLDVAPTLLAAAGIEASETFRGSPLPLDESEAMSDRLHPLFAEHPRRIAVISGRHYYSRDRAAQLATVVDEEGEPLLDLEALLAAQARVAELWAHAGGEESDLEARRKVLSEPLPPYDPARPAGIAPHLEPLVANFLAPPEAAPPAQSPLPE